MRKYLLLLIFLFYFSSNMFSQVTYPCGVYFIEMNGTSNFGLWTQAYNSNDITLATWVKITDAATIGKRMAIFSRYDYNTYSENTNFGLYLNEDGKFVFRALVLGTNGQVEDSLVFSTKPVAGIWYHIAVTFSGTSNQCNEYVNGLPDAAKSFAGPLSYVNVGSAYSYTLAYGARYFPQGGGIVNTYFKGNFDEAVYASKVISADAIKTLAAGIAPGNAFISDNSIVIYNKFDNYPSIPNYGLAGGSLATSGQLYYCPVTATPPVANAGPDKTVILPTNSVNLDGIVTKGTGSITDLFWTKVSGPQGGDFNNPYTETPLVSNLQEGVYVFRLTVIDDNNKQATDDVTVTVKPATPITGIVYNVSCNTVNGSPEKGELAPVLQKNPITSDVVIRLLENGVEKEKTVVDANGKFKLMNAEEGKSYTIEILHTNGIGYDIKYAYQNITGNIDLGEILMPVDLMAEIMKFMPSIKTKQFIYNFLGPDLPALAIDVEGFNTSGYESVFNPFYINELNIDHKKYVDNLANFYASVVDVYALGGLKSDMDNLKTSCMVDLIQNCLELVKWYDNLRRLLRIYTPPTKGDLIRKMAANMIKLAFEKIKSNLKVALVGLAPEAKQKGEEYLSVFTGATDIAIQILKSTDEGIAKITLNTALKTIAANLIEKDYLDYCQKRHKAFISSASISSQKIESAFGYSSTYSHLLDRNSQSLYKQANDIFKNEKARAELLITASKVADAVKGIFDAATKLELAIGQFELAPITTSLTSIAKSVQTTSIIAAYVVSSQASSSIGGLSDAILPEAGFSLHKKVLSKNYNAEKAHSTLSLESLLLQKNNYNQKLTELKTAFNSPYDSAAYLLKISAFNKEDSLYTEEMKKSLNSLWTSADSASIKIPGFSNSLQTTIDQFVTRQYTLRQALFFQSLSYWFDSTKTGYVSELNILADSIILLNNTAVDSLTKLFGDIRSYGIIAPAYLVQDEYQIDHTHEPVSTGNFSYTFTNYGSQIQNNVSFKISAPTAGFNITGSDSVYIGNIQPGESKIISFTFSSPMEDTLGSYEITVHADNGYFNNVTGSLYISKTADSLYTIKDGNWEIPDTWSYNKIPAKTTSVIVSHKTTLNTDLEIKNLTLKGQGSVDIKKGIKLKVNGDLKIQDSTKIPVYLSDSVFEVVPQVSQTLQSVYTYNLRMKASFRCPVNMWDYNTNKPMVNVDGTLKNINGVLFSKYGIYGNNFIYSDSPYWTGNNSPGQGAGFLDPCLIFSNITTSGGYVTGTVSIYVDGTPSPTADDLTGIYSCSLGYAGSPNVYAGSLANVPFVKGSIEITLTR